MSEQQQKQKDKLIQDIFSGDLRKKESNSRQSDTVLLEIESISKAIYAECGTTTRKLVALREAGVTAEKRSF